MWLTKGSSEICSLLPLDSGFYWSTNDKLASSKQKAKEESAQEIL